MKRVNETQFNKYLAVAKEANPQAVGHYIKDKKPRIWSLKTPEGIVLCERHRQWDKAKRDVWHEFYVEDGAKV